MPTIFNEDNTIEQMILSTLQGNGWKYRKEQKSKYREEKTDKSRERTQKEKPDHSDCG